MSINDKIKQILIDKNISPSYFADEIGVQRSSISHILSGRNRPSFDIIQKVIRRFPELGYDWIMEDEPLQPLSEPAPVNQPTPRFIPRGRPPMPPALNEPQFYPGNGRPTINRPASANNPIEHLTATESNPTMANDSGQVQRESIPASGTPAPGSSDADPGKPKQTPSAKIVERILIFYTDGTFREFMPSSGAA